MPRSSSRHDSSSRPGDTASPAGDLAVAAPVTSVLSPLQGRSEARFRPYQRRFLRLQQHFLAFFGIYIILLISFQHSVIVKNVCTIFASLRFCCRAAKAAYPARFSRKTILFHSLLANTQNTLFGIGNKAVQITTKVQLHSAPPYIR